MPLKLDISKIVPELPEYKFLKLSDEEHKYAKSLLPEPMYRCRFKINACTAIANAFRRVVNDELKWTRITCKITNIDTDDPFAQRLTDNIQNRIQLIPCNMGEGELELNFHNHTPAPVMVKSSEIKHKIANFEFPKNIDITEILPNRYINIKMETETGVGGQHAGFRAVSSVYYEAEDVGKYESYAGHPDKYYLGFDCENFVDPKMIVKLTFDAIIDKLEIAQSAIEDFQTIPYKSEKLAVSQIAGGIIRYEFFGETRTLTNILSYFAYLQDPDIAFVMAGDDYPNDPSSLVKIIHKDHKGVLISACKNAIKTIKKIID